MYENKVVLITGASRGIGLVLVNHFLINKATVLGISKGKSSINHKNYFHYSVDLGNPDSIINCFRKEINKFHKRIDILINNAAVLTSQYAMIMPIKNAVDMVNINLVGTFLVSREAAKIMRKSDYGRIINIGSMAASIEPMGDSIYSATKTAIISLANVMAKEFSTMKITCNTLGITAFETDMLRSHTSVAQKKIAEIINNLTIPRMATAEDILNVIDFYVSEKSSYITAQTIYLGGIN